MKFNLQLPGGRSRRVDLRFLRDADIGRQSPERAGWLLERDIDNSARSYYVVGDKITRMLGFRPERGVTEAVLTIWDALERGELGEAPDKNPRYFNIRWMQEIMTKGVYV